MSAIRPIQDLRGKVALITGATRGIGRGIAINLASRGASILGTCSSEKSLSHIQSLQSEIADLHQEQAQQPKVIGVVADILDPEAPSKIAAALQDQFNNKLHILVNNAAITDPTPIDVLSAPRIQDFLTGNITFPLLLMQAVLPALQPSSHIINISSEAVRIASPGVMVYAATKAALESLTRSWAQELGKRPGMQGTTVNAICVGLTNTELWTRYPVEVRGPVEEANFRTTDVADRIAEVDDVALVAGFLAGDASRWMSGSVLEATGGRAKIF